VEQYLISLKNVTGIIVSHNAGLLDNCCTHILSIDRLKLNLFKGNLTACVEKDPEAKSFFELLGLGLDTGPNLNNLYICHKNYTIRCAIHSLVVACLNVNICCEVNFLFISKKPFI
jgi:hypothetical protein